jgi:hypothetical protein
VAVRLPFLVLQLATCLAAQSPRLIDRIEAPIAYVRLDANAAARGPGEARDRGAVDAVQQLLADPGLDTCLCGAKGAPARVWKLVRGVLLRNRGEFELALTGVVPGVGRPLLVLRVQLQSAEAERLHGLLQEGSMAVAHRTVGGQATFRLLDRDAADLVPPAVAASGPGELIELALVGTDLVVGNDDLAMQELLAPESTRTTAAPKHVLAADPEFLALRQRLGVPAGSLFVYGDWPRLGHRLQTSLAGVPGTLLDWSGLGSARRVMLSLSPANAAFEATLLLAFEAEDRSDNGSPAAEAVDGWLAAAQHVAARQLLRELPGAGLGGVVVAVDLADLAARSHRGEHMLRDLRRSFEEYGLDFDRNVLGRLGSFGTVQVLLREAAEGAAPAVEAVYAVRARNKKAAGDLFTDLRRAAEAHGIARLVAAKDRRAPDVLELRPEHEPGGRAGPPICVAVVEDSVLVTFDAGTILRVHDDYRRAAKLRTRRDSLVGAAVQRVGGSEICGLFDVDLQGLFSSLTESMAAAGTSLDLSRVPSRHIGYLALEPHESGSLVRIGVLSSQ